MKKNITSKDPRKKNIVAHLKAKSGGNKVTMLGEDDKVYFGKCMKYNGGKYTDLGYFRIPKDEIDKKPLDRAFEKMDKK